VNELLVQFAEWLYAMDASRGIHESYSLYNWIETTHVLTLMVCLGMLFFIDARMLGWSMTQVPASTIARRLNVPMFIGFSVMFITGILLYFAVPVRTTQSLWFRIKMLLLVAAAINAYLFHRAMKESVSAWDTEPKAPRRLRIGAALSLALWGGVVTTGRLIAYDWYDCYREMPAFINWAAGCLAE
jgi:uncharacterized membrane protein